MDPHTYLPTTDPWKQHLQGAFNAIMSLWVLCGLLVFLLAFTLLEDEARVQVTICLPRLNEGRLTMLLLRMTQR